MDEIGAYRLGLLRLPQIPPNRMAASARYALGPKAPLLKRAPAPGRLRRVHRASRHRDHGTRCFRTCHREYGARRCASANPAAVPGRPAHETTPAGPATAVVSAGTVAQREGSDPALQAESFGESAVSAASSTGQPTALRPLANRLLCGRVVVLSGSVRLSPRSSPPTTAVGLPTGIRTVDDVLRGLQPGRFYLAAAAPGTCASLLPIAAARTTALDVLYAASGLSRADVTARIPASHHPVDHRRLRTGRSLTVPS